MSDAITPIIHLGGTSASDLLEQQQEVLRTLNLAITAMQRAFPNARDFTYDTSRYAAAREQAERELEQLDVLRRRHMALADHAFAALR